MNISPTYPNLVPIALQPSTESARRDNQVRERIPALPQGEASARESQVGSDKERFRSQEGRNNSSDTRPAGQAGSSADGAYAVEGKPDRQSEQGSQQGDSRSGDEARQQRQDASQEQRELAEFKDRDQEVRAHEQAHQRAGGQYAGSPTYSVTRGPDGRSYAVGGEVQIDVSPCLVIPRPPSLRCSRCVPPPWPRRSLPARIGLWRPAPSNWRLRPVPSWSNKTGN